MPVSHLALSTKLSLQVPDGTRAAVVGFDWGTDQLQFEVTQNGKTPSLSNGSASPPQEQGQVRCATFVSVLMRSLCMAERYAKAQQQRLTMPPLSHQPLSMLTDTP